MSCDHPLATMRFRNLMFIPSMEKKLKLLILHTITYWQSNHVGNNTIIII